MGISQNEKDGNGIRHIAFIMDGNGRWAKKRLSLIHISEPTRPY